VDHAAAYGTPRFPPGYALRYESYGLGMGSITVEGAELLGHTGFIGAFAFYAPLRCGAGRHPQRLACRPLASRGHALPGAAPGSLMKVADDEPMTWPRSGHETGVFLGEEVGIA
jgi:hypothetical protein